MTVAELTAALVGPYLIAVALAIVLNGEAFRAMLAEAVESRAFIFIAGLIAVAIGAALVKLHNVWVWDWPVLVTLLGWASLAGGFLRVIWPDAAIALARRTLDHPRAMNAMAIIALVVGAVLVNVGFF